MPKVAVATTSGQEIDGQFGQAPSFHIYDVAEDGSFRLLERRPVILRRRLADSGADETVEQLRDVSAVLARRIGSEAMRAFLKRGIRAFPIFGAVDQALITYGRGHKLLGSPRPAGLPDLQ